MCVLKSAQLKESAWVINNVWFYLWEFLIFFLQESKRAQAKEQGDVKTWCYNTYKETWKM